MSTYIYELMALDCEGNCDIENEENLIHSILSNWKILKKAEIKKGIIIDKELHLSISVVQINKDEADISIKKTFIIKVEGKYNEISEIRIQILKHLNAVRFDRIYMLNDDISSDISLKIYPKINEVENLLRKYLVKFLVTKLWPDWWKLTANSDMTKKANLRKNNELVFSEFIDNQVYLIDFGELWKMIYAQSSWFISREDILGRILDLDENEDAIKKLKDELKSNYIKFFKNTFKDNGFQEKWEALEKLRHKVAHNNLFTTEELELAKSLYDDVKKIIESANQWIDTIQFSSDEKTAFRENISMNSANYETIDKSELLEKLRQSEEWASKKESFVWFSHFVVNFLGSMWYNYRNSNNIINELVEEWIIEKYEYTSENNPYPIAAIRIRK